MRLLVTGASGFVGRSTCAEALRRGHEVMSLVREPGTEPKGTRRVRGDLLDSERLDAAVSQADADCIIHLAAETGAQRDESKITEVNVRGTRRLLDICEANSLMRFVFCSTVVTGDNHGAVLNESSELPVETAYGRSKQAGEEMLRESTLDGIIVRPSHIYGAGGWFASEIVQRLRTPLRLAVVGGGNNWWDMVRVEDVATALVDAAERAPAGEIYHCVDDDPIRYYDFVKLTAKALGVGRPRRLPAAIARLAVGRDPVIAVTRSARSSNAKLKEKLDWTPQWPTSRRGVSNAVALLDGGAE